jgi:hypothetical protein
MGKPRHVYRSGFRICRAWRVDHGFWMSFTHEQVDGRWRTIGTVHTSLRAADAWLYLRGYRRVLPREKGRTHE